MGLKGKILGTVASVAVEKIAKSEKVNNIVDSAVNKLGKSVGWERSAENLNITRSNHFVIQTKSNSISTIARAARGAYTDAGEYWGKYKIFDSLGCLKYITEIKEPGLLEELVYDKETLYVFNNSNITIGKIKENVFSYRIPLLEKDAKRCTVFLSETEYFEIKRYYSFEELCYDVNGCDYSIDHKDGKNYKIKKGKKIIADIHKIAPAFRDGYTDDFVVEYDDVSDEVPVILLTLAIKMLGK